MIDVPPPRALLLDLDGTLIDSLPLLSDVYRRLAAELAIIERAPTFEESKHLRLAELLAEFARLSGVDATELARRHAQLCDSSPSQARALPGARELLDTAALHGLPCLIVTNAVPGYAERVLAATGLRDGISGILSASAEGLSKHDDAIWNAAAGRVAQPLASCWSIDDDTGAVIGARAAGLGVALHTGDAAAAESAGLPAVADLAQFRRLLLAAWWRDRIGIQPCPGRLTERPWFRPDAATCARVAEHWQTACAEDPSLYDGDATVLVAVDNDGIAVAPVPYRHVHAAAHGVDGALGPHALGSLGVTGVTTSGAHVLVGERARTSFAGRLEVVPAGVLTTDSWDDPTRQLLTELHEEVSDDWDVELVFLGWYEDHASRACDVVYWIDTVGCPSLPERPTEHERLAWLDWRAALAEPWSALEPLGMLAEIWPSTEPGR